MINIIKSLKNSLVWNTLVYTFFPFHDWVVTYTKLSILLICIYTISGNNCACGIKICLSIIFIYFRFNRISYHTHGKIFSIVSVYTYVVSCNDRNTSEIVLIFFKDLRRTINVDEFKILKLLWYRIKMQEMCFSAGIGINTTTADTKVLNDTISNVGRLWSQIFNSHISCCFHYKFHIYYYLPLTYKINVIFCS